MCLISYRNYTKVISVCSLPHSVDGDDDSPAISVLPAIFNVDADHIFMPLFYM